MSIPISDIVDVSIAVSPNAIAVEGFGPLLFMSKLFKPVSGELPVRSYTSFKEVQEDFPSGEIYKAAQTWFAQKPTPKTFLVGSVQNAEGTPATAGTATADRAAVLAEFADVTEGSIEVSGSPEIDFKADKLDFSQAKSFSDIEAVLTEAVSQGNAKFTVSQEAGRFKFTTEAKGSDAYFIAITGDVANLLKMDSSSMVAGTAEASITTDLAAIANTPFNFFYVAVERSFRQTDLQLTAATWCEASGKVFGWGDHDRKILTKGTKNSFGKAKSASLRNTICVYDASENFDEYPEISILARAATVNFNVANSVIVLAFKKGPTVTTADLSSGQLSALRSYNGNAFISVADNSMFMDGKMADGTWFDTVQGVEWLTQKIRLNVFNLFYTSTTKIPWTDTGVNMVNQQITLGLELAKTNGLIAPGYDNEGVFYPEGYKVISTPLELLQSQKGARIWEGSSFIAIGSGALQGAQITGTFVQ